MSRVEMGLSYEELAVALHKPSPDAARKAARRALIRLARAMDRGRTPPPPRLHDLTDAVLDGSPVDWEAAESSAAERHRGLLRQLRLSSALAEIHRRPPMPDRRYHARAILTLPTRWGPLDVLEHVGLDRSAMSIGPGIRAWIGTSRSSSLPTQDTTAIGSSIIAEGLAPGSGAASKRRDHLRRRPHRWLGWSVDGVRARTDAGETAHRTRRLRLAGGVTRRHRPVPGTLRAVDQAGVVHRDIKTQNVVREDGGRLVLMDFGTGHVPEDETGDQALSGDAAFIWRPELFSGGAHHAAERPLQRRRPALPPGHTGVSGAGTDDPTRSGGAISKAAACGSVTSYRSCRSDSLPHSNRRSRRPPTADAKAPASWSKGFSMP